VGIRKILELTESHCRFQGARQATYLGAILGDYIVGEDMAEGRLFDGIPSMASVRELRLLQNFFSINPMNGPVLEVGPYLGATTAAIGHGLAAQSFRDKFFTIDAFEWNDSGFKECLRKDVDILQKKYSFSVQALEEISLGKWMKLFHDLHSPSPYGAFLRVVRAQIPFCGIAPFPCEFLADEQPLGALFVDGFKSWAATYNALKAFYKYISPGTFLIFQDFSWFDCYWLPILVERLQPRPRLLFKVDNTAVFRVCEPINVTDLDKFGPAPDPNCYDNYAQTLKNYASAMFHSGDEVGYLGHSSQLYMLAHAMKKRREAEGTLTFLKELCERVNACWLSDLLCREDHRILAGGDV
jgi:hypothetical protein